LQKKAKHERRKVSELREVLEDLEGKHEQLRQTVAREGGRLAETHRQNDELGGRM
jgi:DNA-binding winged helix-turn-helix (wHTH) protein